MFSPGSNSTALLDGSIHLVESDSVKPSIQYVALSHRWGKNDLFKTTRANFNQMAETGMRVGDLPKTFKEAIQFAYLIGYSYVWIDSLCIIQDDEEDWKREARRMSLVFSKAACVIEAVDGSGFDSGLASNMTLPANNSKLDTRAWVLQEQMMPPRSLKFTNGTVLWECLECDASEDHPNMVKRGGHHGTEQLPTHPKDIFTFFRDYRLPPKQKSETEIEPGILQEIYPDEQARAVADASTPDTSDVAHEGHNPDVSGSYVDSSGETVVINYGNDLPGHRLHLIEYTNFNNHRNGDILTMAVHPDDESEPFGSFMASVTDLLRPHEDYHPLLQAWWQFVPLYTKRQITNVSDKFLAINGITSIVQRWTHLRNTFGLWFHFLEKELCWYIDPTKFPGSRPKTWLGPTWSWMSTCDGTARNDFYTRWPGGGDLRIKPEIKTPSGTSFDMPLPFVAWMNPKYHSIDLKGNLRKATVRTIEGNDGKACHSINVDPVGRFSDHEKYDFRPDCAHEFPVGSAVAVYCLHLWHYSAEYLGTAESTDVYIILRQKGERREVKLHTEDIPEEEMLKERTMGRLGYMEVTYGRDERRDAEDIYEDSWWWWIRLQ
jgi:hypothetical protein